MRDHLPILRRLSEHHVDFVVSCVVVAFVVSFFFYPPMREQAFWTGATGGWLNAIAPVGTVVVAAVAALFAGKTYILGQKKELSDRFERGVALLDGASEAKKTAGIIILEDVASAEGGGPHAGWVREFLPTAINEWNAATASTIGRPVVPRVFEPTPRPTMRAIQAISKVGKPDDKAISMPNMYLSQNGLTNVVLRNLICHNCIIYESYLQASDFDGSVLSGLYFASLDVHDCSLRNARLQIQNGSSVDVYIDQCDLSGSSITAVAGVEVGLSGCKVDGLVIGGAGDFTLENCWFESTPPVLKSIKAINSDPTIYKAKSTSQRTKSGWPTWKSGPDDEPVHLSMVAPGYMLRRAGKAGS